MKRTLSYLLLVVFAMASLSLPAAAEKTRTAEAVKQPRLVTVLWHLFERLTPSVGGSHAGMDPDGKPSREAQTQVPLEDPDSHAGLDPDGKT